MTISAAFSIEGTTVPTTTGAAVSVAYGATVDLALLSTTGAVSIDWSIVGSSDPTMTTPTITKAGSPLGATASFVFPATVIGDAGAAYGVKCEVTDGNGDKAAAYGIVGVPSSGNIVPVVAGEKAWRHATHGWATILNTMVGNVATLVGEAGSQVSISRTVVTAGASLTAIWADMPTRLNGSALQEGDILLGTIVIYGKNETTDAWGYRSYTFGLRYASSTLAFGASTPLELKDDKFPGSPGSPTMDSTVVINGDGELEVQVQPPAAADGAFSARIWFDEARLP